ncbi:MAG TPA: tail fiber protein [Actinomycetota bacterium]|nr:tail fiber protein [Actinomycetota bacterium]
MADPFVAEIRIFGFNFPPTGWAFCNGQILPISQNTALFSLIGTFYGGDGKSNFALPNLQGSAPMNPGQGQGLSLRDLGEVGGTETVTLLESEMPPHNHTLQAANLPGNSRNPANSALSRSTGGNVYLPPAGAPQVQMAAQAVSTAGSSAPHNNMPPYLTVNFCIALEGVFPPRS